MRPAGHPDGRKRIAPAPARVSFRRMEQKTVSKSNGKNDPRLEALQEEIEGLTNAAADAARRGDLATIEAVHQRLLELQDEVNRLRGGH